MSGGERWGDYSQVVVDPTDNMTMWAFGEFGSNSHFVDSLGNTQFNRDTTYNWAVQVTEIRAPAPPKFKIEFDRINPALIKITSVGSGCQGFFDPGAGYQKRLKAQIFGANTVQVKRVTFTDGANLVLTVNDKQFVPGSYILVITNPDGQSSFQTFNINQNVATQAKPVVINDEQITTKDLAVFPSPAASGITVQTSGLLANSTIEVFDINGSSILKKFAIEKQTTTRIDVSRFASGTYFIQVKNNKESFAAKFVVNR